MDKEAIDLEVRLRAMEYVIAHIGRVAFVAAGVTAEQMKNMRQVGRERLLNETFPGLDAAVADHVSAELADKIDQLLGDVETQVLDVYRKVSQAGQA